MLFKMIMAQIVNPVRGDYYQNRAAASSKDPYNKSQRITITLNNLNIPYGRYNKFMDVTLVCDNNQQI